MTTTLRRLLVLLAAVFVLAACKDDGSTVTPAEATASTAPSAGSGVPPSPAADCSIPIAESTPGPTEAAGATTGTGMLQGHLYGVGGPAPGLHEAWSGVVTITGPVHREITLGPDGAYAVALPAGRYEIVGRSPHFGGCTYPCQARKADDHRVLAGRTTTLNTYCSMD